MPNSPPKLCSVCRRASGCDCRAKTRRDYDARRGTPAQRGYDREWVAFRAEFIKGTTTINGREVANTLCWDCAGEGIVKPMHELHHVVKVADDPSRRLDPTNVRPLCRSCHQSRTSRGE